ncbi:MAG: ABC transporter ATP-binding protein [Phenylobacterium sp.]|uniref:ABC transporter ATP-binding protein n=1 Tax=Phenylobacterium sp. TaxID=1871053 RepID=UPI001A5DD25F|nr:ABC transporter ATP-binding protein [Phenylobacterium sp.]MBL8556423.1 ABC transporter ATP-binding protein [Phenylobacterium sp.]
MTEFRNDPADESLLADEGPAIEVTGLTSAFGDHVVHEDLDLVVERGEIMGIVGGSGTGKSVLLNTIIGLRRPQAGTIKVFGQELDRASRRHWSELEQSWGVLFQGGALFSNLTVRENVAAPMFEHTRMSRREAYELADLKIAMVGLRPEAAGLKPAELSGGMKKRAGLARALALDPELLFLDEPTSGLDPIGAAAFDELIKDLADSLDLTVFMITHDLDSLYAITDRVAVLADRHVVATATVHELERSDHPWIREYFLGPRGRTAREARMGEDA